ncbi:MAG: Flp pilus assembly complex ATPase component TadA [Methanomicrobiaceae archaeon]|nr:Flp pilus assembly complex ATPase component TadA [Methanomicrobiaceae archaeon]
MNEKRSLSDIIRKIRQKEEKTPTAGETADSTAPNRDVSWGDLVAGGETQSEETESESPVLISGEPGEQDSDDARSKLGSLVRKMKSFESGDTPSKPGQPEMTEPQTEEQPVIEPEDESVPDPDEQPVIEPENKSVPDPDEQPVEDEETFRSLIDDLISSHDEATEGFAPPRDLEAGIIEDVLGADVSKTPGLSQPSDEAQKTRWSDKDEGTVETEGVVTVDEVDDYANMILPRGATFEVEELHLTTSSAFDLVDKSSVLSEIDEIWKPVFPTDGVEEPDFGGINVGKEEEKKGLGALGFLKGMKPGSKERSKIIEYQPGIHGPLVDLSFESTAGQEEVELYPVNEPFAYVRIIYDNTNHTYLYKVIEPELTPAESELILELQQRLFETLDVNTKDMTRESARKALRDAIDEIIVDYGIKLSPAGREKVLYNIEKAFLGDGLIDPVMHDKYIEDISCDGLNTPLFIYHTSYESIQTSLMYTDAIGLDSFVTKLAQRAGKYISIAEPMLDATMSDGSRIQMTLGQEVTAHGSTFTIRKFRDEPITPTDLIEWSTFSPLSIAFIWLAVENGKSCIFCGGTASGKTTSLNAISLFIPPLAKIVTLEDTRELKLPHPNWIPSVTRESFDSAGKGSIDMYELLRAALRQRPEYILVGEVRGQEAQTLFQAMSTGHVTYATMHADSVSSAVHRLENPPLNVPRNMLTALDLVSIQVQARIGGQRIRRNKALIEILDIDPRTNELITNEVFKWNAATDEIRYSGKSYILEEVMEERGWSEARMREELKRRQEILEWMRIKKLRHYKDVSKVLISYYRDPEAVMEIVRGDLYE